MLGTPLDEKLCLELRFEDSVYSWLLNTSSEHQSTIDLLKDMLP